METWNNSNRPKWWGQVTYALLLQSHHKESSKGGGKTLSEGKQGDCRTWMKCSRGLRVKQINLTRPAVPWALLILLNGPVASADVWGQEHFPLQTEGNLSAEIQKTQETELQPMNCQKLLFQGKYLLYVSMEMAVEKLLLHCNENLSLKAAVEGHKAGTMHWSLNHCCKWCKLPVLMLLCKAGTELQLPFWHPEFFLNHTVFLWTWLSSEGWRVSWGFGNCRF